MADSFFNNLIDTIDKCSLPDRRKLIADYEYETFDDNYPLSLPPTFFAELLRKEKDDICRWYEIKALGEWHADEFVDLVLDVIRRPDVTLNETSLHLISATALGKMGPSVIPKIESMLDQVGIESKIALIDALGETHSVESIPLLIKMIPAASSKEFIYICSSCVKCTKAGSEALQQIYYELSPDQRIIVFDALAKYAYNDAFLHSLITKDPITVKQAVSLRTKGVLSLIGRSKNRSEWSIS